MPTDRPLTHEERQALIRKPFPVVRVHSAIGKSWGGACMEDASKGKRNSNHTTEDFWKYDGLMED